MVCDEFRLMLLCVAEISNKAMLVNEPICTRYQYVSISLYQHSMVGTILRIVLWRRKTFFTSKTVQERKCMYYPITVSALHGCIGKIQLLLLSVVSKHFVQRLDSWDQYLKMGKRRKVHCTVFLPFAKQGINILCQSRARAGDVIRGHLS